MEGPHDVEFAYRLLSVLGLKRLRYKNEVDPALARLIPSEYPPKKGDLQMRMPIPLFLQSHTHAIAVQSAVGDTRLALKIEEAVEVIALDGAAFTSVGILLDSDSTIPVEKRYAELRQNLSGRGMLFPERAGCVSTDTPILGAFILPDNASSGTLEDLLLDSAGLVYPSLLELATHYVDTARISADLIADDLTEISKPAGRKNAIIGAMANILRPSKAVQTSIQDNRWLRDPTLALPRIAAAQGFLKTLFELAA